MDERKVKEYWNNQVKEVIKTTKTPLENNLDSPIKRIKLFNNQIKAKLFDEYIFFQIIDSEAKREVVCLDIGCGRGGDIHKWMHSGVTKVVGFDMSDEALREAQKRYQTAQTAQTKLPQAKQKSGANNTEMEFFIMNMNDDWHALSGDKFNVVTAHFCIHYACKSPNTIQKLLSQISSVLLPNGVCIFTLVDPQKVKEYINTNSKIPLDQNPSIKSILEISPGCTSNRYTFRLDGAMASCEEYYVPENIIELAANHSLSVILDKSFEDYGATTPKVRGNIMMEKLTREERQVVSLYKTIVFKRN